MAMTVKAPFPRFWPIILLLSIFSWACTNQKSAEMERRKRPDQKTENGTLIVTAPIVSKRFVDKRGRPGDKTELYIQRSTQDYFIKFCESKISREELEEYLSTQTGLIQTATLEVAFRNGSWDSCDENEEVQSRIGEYAVIYRIIKK